MKDHCGNCEHFDGDAFCSLPEKEKLISGHIREPEYVVCSRHAFKDRNMALYHRLVEKIRAADRRRMH